ncbi:leucine-rich repeat-containing G-protein coupled receptor 5A-like [Mya arenaria]|uniref:leucine-rich repeat-containing G-protein coupled receptor 5A-like n=1 Tax=Mya arenaria TaxID=6604 RepID=UPI0022E11267|nr:leucine-rich repeat-containing G-protein coupled receptor 5A-like [Mya arenaria]
MLKILIFTILTATLGRGFIFNDPCPAPPPCRCYGTVVNCVYKHLTTVPLFNFTALNHRELTLDLRTNKFTSVPAHALGNINETNIDRITIFLQENRIASINDDAFDGFGNSSVEINLSNNNLTSLPRALMKIANLDSLWLLDNHVAYLSDGIMTHIGRTLKTFHIDMSALAIWPRAMNHLTEVTELHLTNIPFRTLPDTAFGGMLKIERFEIEKSKLNGIPAAICQLRSLIHLEFQFNTHIPNTATHLMSTCAVPLSNVGYVSLNYNNLFFFPSNVFKVFPNTTTLGLSNNFISEIPADAVPTGAPLYYFYIGHNQFTRLPSVISKMPELLTLIASGNKMTSIDGTTLSNLKKLRQVTLNDIPLAYIDPHAFSTSYTLRDLHLERTNLTSVPAAIMHTADRFSASLVGSPVVCTCSNLAFIRAWPASSFQSHEKRIRGDCVNINSSIQDFIINMEVSCP